MWSVRPRCGSKRWQFNGRSGEALGLLFLGVTFSASVQTWTLPGSTPSREASRRSLLLTVPVGAAISGPNIVLADDNPLPPPSEKAIAKDAAKIQESADFLFFEVKGALKSENKELIQRALGNAGQGAFISPLETGLMLPLEQIISTNVDAQEEGWVTQDRKFRDSFETMKQEADNDEWKKALKAWEGCRASLNVIFSDINARGEKPYFVLLDEAYEKRAGAYLQAKKDKLAVRNAVGTVMMR